MDYPYAVLESKNPVIRLRVAALCACIGHGYFNGKEFSEDELAPFINEKPIDVGGTNYNAWLRPHAFAYIPATGKLEMAEEQILKALIISIKNKEIIPVQLKMRSIEGDIDVYETWINAHDMDNWCEIRDIDLGDLYDNYIDDEGEINIAMADKSNAIRSQFESPYFNTKFNPRVAGQIKQNQVTVEQYLELLAENVVLRSSQSQYYPAEQAEEKPMQARERHTFLAIIAVLCKEAGHDYGKHAKTAGILKRTAELMGLNLGETTIEGKLKLIPDALENRISDKR